MEAVASAVRTQKDSPLHAWGSGSFENEAAMRWVEGLEDADDLDMVEETFEKILELDAQTEAPDVAESAAAIAAAETVAALGKNPAKSLPEEVRQWCFDNPGADIDEVQAHALQALGTILQDSKLRDLFEENGGVEEWETGVEDLRDRLRG